MLIGLAGLKRSGKSTVAGMLRDYGFVEHSFAAPIRNAVADILGVSLEFLEECKEHVIPALGVTARSMMQTLGTEWGRRMVNDRLWLVSMAGRIAGVDAVISDVRFDNEAEFIRQRGGKVVRVDRPGSDRADDHASEAGISESLVDYVIHNDGDLAALADKVRILVAAVTCNPAQRPNACPAGYAGAVADSD